MSSRMYTEVKKYVNRYQQWLDKRLDAVNYPSGFTSTYITTPKCQIKGDDFSTVFVGSEILIKNGQIRFADGIEKEFEKNWKGCTLTEIYYAGDDEISNEYKDWTNRNEAHEVIVLVSSFDVDSSGGDGSLNPNETYDDWKWILVRDNGGQWKHVDHGY